MIDGQNTKEIRELIKEASGTPSLFRRKEQLCWVRM